MKRFTFRLQPLLHLRRIREELALNEFSKQVRKIQELEEKMRQISKELSESVLMLTDNLEERFLFERYYTRLDGQRTILKQQINDMQEDLTVAREKFIISRQQKKVLSIIEQRHYLLYCEQRRKWESKQNMALNGQKKQKRLVQRFPKQKITGS